MDLFTLTGGFLMGTAIIVPVIYLLSWLTGSMLWGAIAGALLLAFALTRIKVRKINVDTSSALFLVFALTFSTWMMTKTFHGGAAGELFVGSNNIFDFGLSVGLMRSIAWGANIPFMSPFFSGLPLFYHFFFIFWTALLHNFGIPTVWAINIPSILSLTALLVAVYYLPQVVAKQKPIVGWIAVALTITNSSLTFWKILPNLASVWHLPTYPFAGPYDGSVISIFVTLNNYVNQRHLAFAIALGLYIFMLVRKQNAFALGVLTGFMALWNIALYPVVLVINTSLYCIRKEWKPAMVYALAGAFVGLLWMLPYAGAVSQIPTFLAKHSRGPALKVQWNLLDYLWQNLGLLPVIAGIGFLALQKKMRAMWIPFIALFILIFVIRRGFEQKSYSLLIIGINVLAAVGVTWLWKKMKIAAIALVFVLTISGVVDLMPIKNEFAYPLIAADAVPVISWIQKSTPRDAVFVSYSDMIDPVVLAGRRNYFGFFGNVGWYSRAPDVRRIYEGDAALASARGVSYVLVPKWQKNDFPYTPDTVLLSKVYDNVYEDEKFIIFRIGNSDPSIIIINPLRGNGLGHETDDLTASLKAQWDVTKAAGVRATWLFQYGALENAGMTEFAKANMQGEEFGLLFEIDRNYAEKAGVPFRGQSVWYASDGLFLNSYDTGERRRLIDAAFTKFNDVFGYYPKTVGAWWIGGDSLAYMHDRYGVVAAMRAADQFNLDMYSIWGTPWNIPYLPARTNQGIPAASYETSAKVVILQWAIRDPFRGYGDPMYSLQDYDARGYTTDYVDYLSSIFLQKPHGVMVMGLENGGTLETFGRFYKTMITHAGALQSSGKATIRIAAEYAQNYMAQKKVLAGTTHFLSTDYGSKDQSFWYTSENYRAALLKSKDMVHLVDLRNYVDKVEEDFAVLPNSQRHLRINAPTVVDSMTFPDKKILVATGAGELTAHESGTRVELFAGGNKIAEFTPTTFTLFNSSEAINTFSFDKTLPIMRPIYGLAVLYALYFLGFYIARKNIRALGKEYLILIIPLVFAIPFLVGNTTFLFDKKESVWLALVSATGLFGVNASVYVSKILPFIILFVLHAFSKKYLFWGYMAVLVFTYIHLPYFPLDKTTYLPVAGIGIAVTALVGAFIVIVYRKRGFKRTVILGSIILPIVLLYIGAAVVLSRTRLALTGYEVQALQFVKDQNKSILHVEEVDFSIRPIYKAVRPLMYGNYRLARLLTGQQWEIVMRPENNVLAISNYDNKLIVIPRYLGTDISETEITSLHLKKVFDNAQIAVFEKI